MKPVAKSEWGFLTELLSGRDSHVNTLHVVLVFVVITFTVPVFLELWYFNRTDFASHIKDLATGLSLLLGAMGALWWGRSQMDPSPDQSIYDEDAQNGPPGPTI